MNTCHSDPHVVPIQTAACRIDISYMWKDIVEVSGPDGLKRIKGFRDKALRGDWNGHRASRLSQQYRVIYRVESDRLIVLVLELTPHDYRRK